MFPLLYYVAIIFGKGHLSTLGVSGVTEEDPQGRNVWQKEEPENCVSRRSQSRKMTLSKDKFDTVRRNPYSIIEAISCHSLIIGDFLIRRS